MLLPPRWFRLDLWQQVDDLGKRGVYWLLDTLFDPVSVLLVDRMMGTGVMLLRFTHLSWHL